MLIISIKKQKKRRITMAKIVNASEFDQEIKDGVVVVDFFATWCGPCKMLAPVFEEVGEELADKAKFIKVNVDESPDIASRYQVMTIPSILVLKEGAQKEFSVGFVPKAQLNSLVEKHL
jgi:thioredoxin 1